MSWLRKKSEKPQFNLLDRGTLKLDNNRHGFEWFGSINYQFSEAEIELTVEVNSQTEPTNEQIQFIMDFESNWQEISSILFRYISECFSGSKLEKDESDLRKMYYLSAIELKRTNSEYWIVLEPEFNVESIFNFLPRFTIKNNEVTWSNLKDV